MTRSRRAFTMVEMVASMVILTILMLGISSSLVIASRAIPDGRSPAKQFVDGSEMLLQIADELSCALTVTVHTATVVEFTLPDRNGDAAEDTIRYSWSGVAGAGLMRQYNGATAAAVLDDVHEFQLSYTPSLYGSPARISQIGASLRTTSDATTRTEYLVELLNQPVWN